MDGTVNALQEGDKYYIGLEDFAGTIGIKLNSGKTFSGYFIQPQNSFDIDPARLDKSLYKVNDGSIYFVTGFYEKQFPVKLKIDPYGLFLYIDSDQDFPVTVKEKNQKRRTGVSVPEQDGFENYRFDKRMFSTPIMDFSYTKGFFKNKQDNTHTDGYQFDLSMLAFGMDTYLTVFDNHEPFRTGTVKARLLAERTFLEEPKNAFNLTELKAGDIPSLQSTLFDHAEMGRGVYASSFKDLVMTADKTIDLSGPLTAGWEVELYLNNQLISYRQSGSAGLYNFSNIPVSYGLNVFKLVFYGPYGETRVEEKRYYSGTSPVKKQEFGYDISIYQPDRFLIESNEFLFNKTNQVNFNAMLYYGLTDNLTLMGGQARTVDKYADNEVKNFSNIGLQAVLSGASVQYNMMYSLDNKKIGHHADIQGNIYIGDILARYEYYGYLESPVSYYNGIYLKDLKEIRLSGNLYKINIPYYISYQIMDSHEKETYREIRARLSPTFWRYYTLSIESVFQKSLYSKYNYTEAIFSAQFNELGLSGRAQYFTYPQSQLNNFGAKIDYRVDRNTYVTLDWAHYKPMKNRKQTYSFQDFNLTTFSTGKKIDIFSLSVGRLFSFGGLTLGVGADSDKNYFATLTYNISLGKFPDRSELFTNAQTKMTQRGAVVAKVKDENNEPVQDAKIWVTGTEKPVKTNEDGEALVTDIQPYEKAVLRIFLDEIEDISLYPETDRYKMVFRPGTVQPFDITLTHKGAVEGQVQILQNGDRYTVKLVKAEYMQEAFTDSEGFFVFDDAPYGQYEVKVYDKADKLVGTQAVKIDDTLVTMNERIKLTSQVLKSVKK